MSEFDLFGGAEEPAQPQIWSVSDLTEEIKDLLESKVGDVKVSGEISNFRRQSSGHLYFSLKDEGAQLASVMFRGDASRLRFDPQDGDQVVAAGMVTVYKPRGNYQIRIRSLKPSGKGGLQAQFEALKLKLSEEGLFDASLKKQLPRFPRRIGLITSPTGAAVRDFLQVIGRRCPHIQVVLGGVRVQGEEAAGEVAAMLRNFNELADVDLIVITRGGGSLEDLWAFNEEALAREIASSRIPVISAIGHEIDFTIADFVADLRAPTPSAAAEILATSQADWRERLQALEKRLRLGMNRQIMERRARVDQYRSHYVFKEPIRLVETAIQRVDELRDRFEISTQRTLQSRRELREQLSIRFKRLDADRLLKNKKHSLLELSSQLKLLSPQGVLNRGYSLLFDEQGGLVRNAASLAEGDGVRIQLKEGRIYAKVDKISQNGLIESNREKARRS